MNSCIYCCSEVPSDASREHIIPQSFGVFSPDLTLDCVCDGCNRYFGRRLEWPMRNQSFEGTRRIHYGLKGMAGGVGTDGVILTIAEGIRKGARTSIRTDKRGQPRTDLLPQIGARRGPSDEIEWCLEKDLSVEFAGRYPKGSEFFLLGGEAQEGMDRLLRRWQELCPTFVYQGVMDPPYGDKDSQGMVLLHAEQQELRLKMRFLCKIAFNYMAFTCHPQFARSASFDSLRAFIRDDLGEAEGRVFERNRPMAAEELLDGGRVTDGHMLTIDCRPHDGVVAVQLALFNLIPYRIPMCTDYFGPRFTRGHHFDVDDWKVTEMRTEVQRGPVPKAP